MTALHGDLVAAIEAGETLVCQSPQRAAAVRAAWAHHQLARGRTVWATPDILHFDAWAERVLDEQRDAGQPVPRLLSPVEQLLLWRELGHDLVERRSLQLLGAARIADALRASVRVVQEYRIPVGRLARSEAAETQWLLACLREIGNRCASRGARLSWMDVGADTLQHAAHVRPVRLVGFAPRMPAAQRQFLDAFQAAGGGWTRCGDGDATPVTPQACAALDPQDEVRQIARWCRARLEEQPAARLLVVIADLDSRRAITERALFEELDPPAAWDAQAASSLFTVEGGVALVDAPLVGRFLESLAVLVRPLERDDWLRWLRSWSAGAATDPARQRLLRTANEWQGPALPLADLLQRAGLAGGEQADDPDWLARLRRAATTLQGSRQPTHVWAQRFATAIDLLDPDAAVAADSATHQLRQRWNDLLGDYAGAHEFIGAIDAGAAYGQLRALAQRTRFAPAAGSAVVTITPSLNDPVIGYDGIWVAGLHADVFPAAPRVDPYVPWALQVEFGVAAAIPERCLEVARERLAAWRRSTSALVLSYATESAAAEQSVSPLVAHWFPEVTPRLAARSPTATVQRLAAGAPLERYVDDAGAAWPAGRALRGGAGTLARSNECAFLGYAELRLDARDPDAAAAGLPTRTRGVLLHRAAQLLWERWRSQAALAALDAADRRRQVEDAVATVIDAELARERDPILVRALRREQRRAAALLEALADGEARRSPFEVIACEKTLDVELDGARLELRIDRIDALGTIGAGMSPPLAIFDYKTGRAVASDWSSDRPDTMQWLVYAAAVAESGLGTPVALCAIRLTDGEVSYQGVAATPQDLAPLLGRTRNAVDWATQQPIWRRQVAERIGRVLDGDARLDPRPDACRSCRLHILCRRAELLAPAGTDEPSTGESPP